MPILQRAVVPILSALVVAASAVALPAGASASVSPSLTLFGTSSNLGGSTSSIGFSINFNSSAGDAVKGLTIALPEGVNIDEETDGGACLTAAAPTSACQMGSGTAEIDGVSSPLSIYLIEPQGSAYLAGIEFVAGPQRLIGDLTFGSSTVIGITPSVRVGMQLEFQGLSATTPVNSLSFTLTGLTLPSSCLPASASVTTTSQLDAIPVRQSAAYQVSDCNALPYQPAIGTATVTRRPGSTAGSFEVEITDPPGNSTTQNLKIEVPPNISPNQRLLPCLNGVTCTIGAVVASSPIMPSSQLSGTITATGTVRALVFDLNFPAPTNLRLTGAWGPSFTGPVIAMSTLPDIPLNSLTLNFTGNNLGGAFVIECYPTKVYATAAPWSGALQASINAGIGESGCASSRTAAGKSKPLASASLSGTADAPRLSLHAAQGRHGPGIKSLSIAPPSGLRFSRGALAGAGGASKQALSVSGASSASARIRNGTLVVTFKHPVARSALSVGAPLLAESASLYRRLSSVHALATRLTIRVTDDTGHRTKLTVALKLKR